MTMYRHYKGGIYSVVAWATDEPTMTPVVVYRSVDDGRVWVRTCKSWDETVETNLGGIAMDVPRFVRCDNDGKPLE